MGRPPSHGSPKPIPRDPVGKLQNQERDRQFLIAECRGCHHHPEAHDELGCIFKNCGCNLDRERAAKEKSPKAKKKK